MYTQKIKIKLRNRLTYLMLGGKFHTAQQFAIVLFKKSRVLLLANYSESIT